MSGLTFATVLGVPFGMLLGHEFGWRTPFAAIAASGGAVLGALRWTGLAGATLTHAGRALTYAIAAKER